MTFVICDLPVCFVFCHSMKKKVLYVLGLLVLLVIAGIFGGQAWLKSRFEKEALIVQIEQQLNCRVQIDGSSASILSSPAKVELLGIKFAPRDAEVEKPVKDRAKLDENLVVISAERAVLTVELSDLIHGKANIKRLKFDQLDVRGSINNEGHNSLQLLFSSPHKDPSPVVKVKNPDGTHSPDHTQPNVNPKNKTEEERPFHASDLPLALNVDIAGVNNARMDIIDEKNGTRILVEHLHFDVKEMDVSPADLAKHNRCLMEFDGQLRFEKTDIAAPLMDIAFTGDGTLRPFEVLSGEWNPDIVLTVKLKKGSIIGGTPLKKQLRENDAKKLKDYGIDLGDIALGGILGEDAATDVHRTPAKLIVKRDTRLVFPQYEITLTNGSWFNWHEDAHRANGVLVVNADVSANMLGQAQKALAEKYGDTIASLALTLLNTALLDDQKRLVLKFKSRGKLSQPEVNIDNVLNDIKDVLKDAGSSLLNGLLK